MTAILCRAVNSDSLLYHLPQGVMHRLALARLADLHIKQVLLSGDAHARGDDVVNTDVVTQDRLPNSDLRVDALYQGQRKGNSGDDPLNTLMSVSLMGGFRYRGTMEQFEMLVLTTTLNDLDWPDRVDRETGVFTYYGDNKKPGRALHDTPRRGNEILRKIFQWAHGGMSDRARVPPIFIFSSAGSYRDQIFLGLAVPGTDDLRRSEDLVAIWKIASGHRFQNYRARFTILDEPVLTREWIKDIIAGNPLSDNAPQSWKNWINGGRRHALTATRSIEYRKKREQLPNSANGKQALDLIHNWFSSRPHDFERCAAVIAKVMLPDIATLDLTRPSRDGGRDGVGTLRLGLGQASILVDFALEAKCYATKHSVGVRELSRLISRLRHRQFGILVTTSFVDLQAYQEIKDDGHPIIVISGGDIIDLLRANGKARTEDIQTWLRTEFPAS